MKKYLLVLTAAFITSAHASTLVYTPVIPSFGGNPLNWNGFLAEASAQNIYHAPTTPPPEESPVEEFKKRLQYLILSRLASKIVDAAFGSTEELPQGSYEIGDFQVQVLPSGDTIQVHLVDTTTGNVTDIEVPMYK